MKVDVDQLVVVNNEAAKRFEIALPGALALADYKRFPKKIVFTHTEVPEAFEGQGIGDKLVHAALEYAKAEHLTILPFCPFFRTYLRRHPAYQSLIDKGFKIKI